MRKNNNYNLRSTNFDAMRTELDYYTFGQPIIINNAELAFEILKRRVNDASNENPAGFFLPKS